MFGNKLVHFGIETVHEVFQNLQVNLRITRQQTIKVKRVFFTYSFDFIFAGNLIKRSRVLSYSASSANVYLRELVDLVSDPTVCNGIFFANVSLSFCRSLLSSVLNE